MALAALNTGEVANKGRAVILLHPGTQVSIGIRFYVLGTDSNEYKRIIRKQQMVTQEKQKRNRRGIYLATPEEQEANALEVLVGMTTGWDEDVKNEKGEVTGVRREIELNEGEFVPFSAEACQKIYEDLGYSWIREQIDAEIGDRRDFLPPAKRS
jgi:hypothetical protein